ncbi:MAG: 1-acyl-sn-glycerol-3-phosphate acyltransferase [Bacteroidetes bacterium]|nr:1-acyl-sn-glycerol-3-phosphate acyltransferase [Bacteroidota bacterium]
MKTFSGNILETLGWKIVGEFPDIKKSITIFAPHTAHIDAIYGKLGFSELGIKYVFLSKKELFFFPMNLIMKKFGSIAVRGVKDKNAIYQVVDLLNSTDELHIVISPEGRTKKMTNWNKGFYYMATKAKVPIVVGYLDYKEKEMGIKGIIYDTDDYKSVMKQINEMYKDVSGKCPEKFVLETIDD